MEREVFVQTNGDDIQRVLNIVAMAVPSGSKLGGIPQARHTLINCTIGLAGYNVRVVPYGVS